ncbi:hypothetical protein OF83DRAFT_500040 [Amylostereum chailletii]|nr:hypothetical protein OF83DRAFT_500040 [Amylostereum chailletii]
MSEPNTVLPMEAQDDPVFPLPPSLSRPKTPPKTVPDMDRIHSTPYSHPDGSSTHAAGTNTKGLYQDVVRPWLRNDLDCMEVTSFDDMLKHMLSLCVRDDVTADKDTLLKDCLDDVFPLCVTEGNDLITVLQENCGHASKEVDRYAPFVKLANMALDKLDGLAGDGVSKLRSAPAWNKGEAIILARNDAKNIHGHHSDGTTERRPDIVLIAEDAAERAYPEFTQQAQAHGTSAGPRAACTRLQTSPRIELEWPEIKGVFEFKMTSHDLSKPPLPFVKGTRVWTGSARSIREHVAGRQCGKHTRYE